MGRFGDTSSVPVLKAALRVNDNPRPFYYLWFKVNSQRDFRSERFLVEGKQTFIAFNLEIGGATLMISR